MTTGTLPNRSKAAKRSLAFEHLVEANNVRLARATVRRKLKTREMTLLEALAEPCCASATLYSLLASQFRWREIKASKFLGELGNDWRTPISSARLVRDLTEREISVLRRALEGRT
jgi:hypothetical protein